MALSTERTSTSRMKYDVFLSFRGIDTRRSLIAHLYVELQNKKGIPTFKDDRELETGQPISLSLLTAIEESMSVVVVFSRNYASSAWCLDELTKIVQCMEEKQTIVIPVFYDVVPSDVRHQKRSFAEAFTRHENIENLEKVEQWRSALTKAANLSGLESAKYGSDVELIEDIVEQVCKHVLPIKLEYAMLTEDFVAFEATTRAMNEVMKALQDDECTAIGVYGMGGSGKTTLVKHVGLEARQYRLFDQVIMAVVSQSPDVRKIQGSLADCLGIKLEQESDDGRAATISEKIMRGSRILIVLDDVWDRIDDLATIGIPSYNELRSRNSKWLLTTRRQHVCHSMKCNSSIRLDTLSEEDAWSLFIKNAIKSFHESTEFYDVGRKVARECAGLPIALVAVARALGSQDIEEWKAAALRLEMSKAPNPEENNDTVNKCIRLSYDYLRGEDAKPFFLLCCLFPEDYDIPIEDLMKYGLGIGLFLDVIPDTIAAARVRANSVAKHLKASCLLLDGRKKGFVRMHDVIRDTAVAIASSEGSLVKAGCKLNNWPTDVHAGCKMISLFHNRIEELPGDELVCSELQILLLRSNHLNEIPDNFFKRQKALRVLDVSSNDICSLPSSLSFLINLQALYLDFCCQITDISILGKLKKLEILSMKHLPVHELPKEIGDLASLRVLDVTAGAIERVPSGVMSKLSKLELYLQCDFGGPLRIDEEAVDDETAGSGFHEFVGLKFLTTLKTNITGDDSLPEHIGCYPNWAHFNISFTKKLLAQVHWDKKLFRDDYPRTLTLSSTVTRLPNWFIKVVTEKTEKLQYIGGVDLRFNPFVRHDQRQCEDLSVDLLVEHDHGRLQNLKDLSLIGLNVLNELVNTTSRNDPVFEKLEVLSVYCCPFMEKLCVGELPHGSLRNLKILRVIFSWGMGNAHNALVPSNLLRRLQNLEIVICDELAKLEHIFGTEGIDLEQDILTTLRVMLLSGLPSLLGIWKGPAPHAMFSNLNFLAVTDCAKLKHLFTVAVAQCLLQLEHLWVKNCPCLKGVIEPSRKTEINKLVVPKLKGLVLINLPQLTGFYTRTTGTATIDHIECPSLEHLYVEDCPLFSTSASDFHSQNQVQLDAYKHYLPVRHRWLTHTWWRRNGMLWGTDRKDDAEDMLLFS